MQPRPQPPACLPAFLRRLIPRAVILALLTLALHAAPPLSRGAAGRSLYRIPSAKIETLHEFLRRGVDIAGTGSDGSLHAFLDDADVAAARALGLSPEPLAGRGPLAAPGAIAAPPGLGDYHTYAEALAEMTTYVSAHPSIARFDTLGLSYEGRLILGVKISDNVGTDEAEPEVLVVGCHHARELMSVELPLYLMRRLLDGYGVDPLLTSLVNTREIWIVPIVNPDGYVYVQNNSGGQADNWWRKNRRPNGDGSFGVDLNRNYAFNWGFDDVGSSGVPSSEVFRGSGPFSEPETAAIRDFMDHHAFKLSMSFHSYGNLFLYPWGFGAIDTPDNPVFQALGDSVAVQNGYTAGNPKNGAIYITNGDMDDWAYGETSLKPRLYGFTFEVNTFEQGGFFPSDALIPSTCALNWGPMLTLLRFADEPRRATPPARPSAPGFLAQGTTLTLHWDVPVPDPANPAVRHDVRRIDSVLRFLDDAEAGTADWDTLNFGWSAARAASGSHAFYSGAGDNRESVLGGRGSVDVAAGDSVVVKAYWDLENFYDYWYAEASSDGGVTWSPLPGNRTTDENPFGHNQGSGITNTSGGAFVRAAFSLGSYVGKQVLVRFHCVTDGAIFGEGLYLDDVTPTVRYMGATIADTGSSSTVTNQPAPSSPEDYQVRAVDGEAQAGPWSDRAHYIPGVTAASAPPLVRDGDRLWPNAPNPFNPRTRLRFRVAAGLSGPYRLALYDVSGRLVAVVASGRDAGTGRDGSIDWIAQDSAGKDLPSGVYLLRLETVRGSLERKITLLR